jgi:hypothetical protein
MSTYGSIPIQPLPKSVGEITYSRDGKYTFSDIIDPEAGRWISCQSTERCEYKESGWKLHISAKSHDQLEALAAVAAYYKINDFKLINFDAQDYVQSPIAGMLQGKTAVFYHQDKGSDGNPIDWDGFIHDASHAIEALGGPGREVQKDRHIPGSAGIYYGAHCATPGGEYIASGMRHSFDLGRTDDPFAHIDLTQEKSMPASTHISQGNFTDRVKREKDERDSSYNLSA